ncbi:MAG: hypothetical protein J7K68_00655 [Candidatus Diapherotrites archaeon]|nr:hypothetical protein [Candidatus Diapherotrites archaeon]
MLEIFTPEQSASIGILLVLLLFVVLYLGWNFVIKKRKIHRVAISDRELYKKKKHNKEVFEEIMLVFSTTPQVIGEITGFAVATVVLAITLLKGMPVGTGNYIITSASLLAFSIAGLCYLMTMEQLTTAISPSLTDAERFRLYEEAINLKTLAFAGLWAGVLLLMALVNMYAVLITAIYTAGLIYRHFELRWVRKER